MGRNFGVVDVLRFRAVRIFVSLMVFAAGGVVLTIVEPPTGRANAAAPVLGLGQACGPDYWHGSVTYETGRSSGSTYTCAIVDNTGGRTGTWTVPEGIVTYDVWGVSGGGGSAGIWADSVNRCGPAGYPGTAYRFLSARSRATYPTFTFTVGSGGSGGVAPSTKPSATNGGSGGSTFVNGSGIAGGGGGNTNYQPEPCDGSWRLPSDWVAYGRGRGDNYGPGNGVAYAGYSGDSGAVIVTYTPPTPAAPTAPTMSNVANRAGDVDVSWTAPAVSKFVVRYVVTATSSDGGTTTTCTKSMASYAVATTCRMTGLDRGKTYTVSVVAYTALDAASSASTASASLVVSNPPVNTALPTIDPASTPWVGYTLTRTRGTWTTPVGSITYSGKWVRRDNVTNAETDIPGAIGTTYVVTTDDLGYRIRYYETADNGVASDQAASTPTAVVYANPAFTSNSPATTGPTNQAFSYTFVASGGNIAYSLINSNLPGTISLSGGVLSGTPTAAGYYTYTIRATNAAGTADTTHNLAIGRTTVLSTSSTTQASGVNFSINPTVTLTTGATPGASVAVTATVVSSPGTHSLTGTLTQTTNASGVATFGGLTLSGVAGSYTIRFSAGAEWPTADLSVTLTAGPAVSLTILTQPVGGVGVGVALATQPVVKMVDAAGNVKTSDSSTVITAAIATGSSFASLGSDFISASSGVATFSGLKVNGAGGNFTLTFTAPGLTSVTSSSFSVSLTSQTITFGALAGKTFGNAAFGISASTTSSLVIAYSSTTPTVCSVTGNTTASAGATGAVVTLLGAGTCTIAANQAGNHQYSAAGQQTQSFAVAQASQSALTLTNASSLSFGDTLTLATSGGSGTGGVTYALVNTGAGAAGTAQCVLNTTTGAMTFGAAGTCSVRATKAADTNYTSIQSSTQVLTVARAAQTTSITSTVPAKPLPGGTYAVTATASSGLTPTLVLMSGAGSVCSLSSGTISFLTAGTCAVLATQAGNGNYSPADPEDMQTIVIGSLNQNITFTRPANMEFGDPDAVLSATASSGLAVTLTSQTTSVCTVTGAVVSIVSVGDCEIKATQAGDARYAAASDETRVFEIIAVVANSPTVRSASAASGEISIGFTSPSFDGGAAIVGYRLVATPTAGGIAVTDDSCVTSPCTINGLENGTEYTVTVAAINAAGVGSASAPSPALTPVTNAMAVQDLVSTPGDGSLAISWTTPADLGGGTFTRYEIRIRVSGGTWPGVSTQNVSSSSTTTATLNGLDNGTEYEVQVITITSANASSFEGNTAVVVAIPRRVPSSPRDLAAAKTTPAGVLVSWSTPLSNGGSPITSYTVTFSGGASCGTVSISSSTQAGSCSATALVLGTTFTITVAAVNAAGSSSLVSTTYTTPTFATSLPAPPPQPPCTTCTRDDGGNDVPGTPATTPAGQEPGTITLTDGVVTVVLSGATGTDAVVNSDGQLEFAIGGKLSAAGSGVLATTTMSTWWNQTASGTGTANSSGVATAEVALPTGTTTGVASVRVDAVSSLGAHRAFYFAVKVVAASSGTSSDSSSTSGGSSTSGTTTTTVAGGSGGTTTTGGGGDDGDDTTTQDVSTPRKPKKSGTFDPKSGENEMLSSTGKVSKPKTTETRSGLTIEGGGVKVGLSPVKGTKMARNASGQMVISGTGTIAISKSGLKPGSKVVVWLRPSMKRLAVAKVKADGTVALNVTLPADAEAGEHTLQIDMVDAKGKAVSMATGFSLSTNRMPVTGSNSAGGLVPAFLLLLLGLGFLAGRRRLRVSPSL